MSRQDDTEARKEAAESVVRASSSARRARLWEGMNRYLAAEERHALDEETSDQRHQADPADRRD